jgi:hypothetical protein
LVRVTIDRFEEDYAVCEVGHTLETRTLHRSELPVEAGAGDTLYFQNGCWLIDKEETNARALRIQDRFQRIKRRNHL